MTRVLRIVVFSPSIISDIGNSQATTVRAMCQAFAESGHDVTHLEQRGNEHLDRMLTERGYAPMRAFNEQFPLIRYRQYVIPKGMERSIWFGREVATADVIVGYPGIPEEVQHEITAFDIPRRIRFSPASIDEAQPLLPKWFDPAVLSRTETVSRSTMVAVAYDNTFDAGAASKCFSLGTVDHPDWTPLSEVQTPEIYASANTVRMSASINLARALLPVAHGAQVELIDADGQFTETITALPDQNNAQIRAAELTIQIRDLLSNRSGQ